MSQAPPSFFCDSDMVQTELLCRRKLTAGKFCPVARPEVLDPGSQVPGKQVVRFNSQNSGKHEKL